ncbi:MAG: two-component regulator propeller domain-containing protein [Bacteroidota bacterium]
MKQQGNDYWVTAHGGGLMKFNPSSTTIFYNKHNSAIPSVLLSAVTIDPNGKLWIGSDDAGLICFDGINTWTTFNTLNSSLPSNEVQSICIKDSIVWIGTKFGLARFNGTTWTIFTWITFGINSYPLQNVRDIDIDSSGNLWICCRHVGLMKYNGSSWTVYNNSNSTITLGINNDIRCADIDSSGNIWVGSLDGISKFNGSMWTNNIGWYYNIEDLKHDASGNLWIYPKDPYLVKYDGTTWQNYIPLISPGLTYPVFQFGSLLNHLYIDDSNAVWMGLAFGLTRYNGNWTDFTSAISSELKSNGINAINYDPVSQTYNIAGSYFPWWEAPTPIWGSGLTVFDGTNWNHHNFLDSCTSQYDCAYSLSTQGSEIWAGTYGGAVKYDGINFTTHLWNTMCTERFTSLLKLNNNLFIGSNLGGIFKFDGTTLTTYMLPFTSIKNISCLAFNDGMLLAGSNSGLISYDTIASSASFYSMANSPIPSDTINDLLKGKPMWIATDRGLVCTDLLTWTTYNTSNSGIPSDFISCITKDSLQNIWLGTKGNGIARFDGNIFTVFNTTNSGLTDNNITDIITDNDNNIWVGTHDGGISVYKYGLWLSENPKWQNNSPVKLCPKMIISPNPLKTTASILISLPQHGNISLYVYNTLGQQVKTLLSGELCEKDFSITWDGTNDAGNKASQGVYICSLTCGFEKTSVRIVVMR